MIDDTLIPVMGPDGVMTTAVKKRVPKPAVLPSSAPVPAPEVQPDIGIRPEIKLLLDETDALLKQVSVHQVPSNNIQENTSGIRPEIQALLDETDTLLKGLQPQPTEAPPAVPVPNANVFQKVGAAFATGATDLVANKLAAATTIPFVSGAADKWLMKMSRKVEDLVSPETIAIANSVQGTQYEPGGVWATLKQIPRIGFYGLIQNAPQIVDMMVAEQVGKALGVPVGTLIGAVASGGTPAAVGTAPAGAVTGGIVGSKLAGYAAVAMSENGSFLRDADRQLRAQGIDTDDPAVRGALETRAREYGLASGASEYASMLVALKYIPIGKARKAALKSLGNTPIFKIALRPLAGAGVEAGTEGTQGWLQNKLTQKLFKDVSKLTGRELAAPTDQDLMQATVQGGAVGLYMNAIGVPFSLKARSKDGGTVTDKNISGIQAKLGAIIQDQTMAGNMDAATTAGRMLKAAKANKLDVLPESHWAAMQRTIIAAATPKPSQIGGSTVVEPTISPEPIPAPAPPPLPLGTPVNGTPGAEMPAKPPAPTAKSSAAIPAPAVAPPAPVVAPVEPAVAPQPPAAKTPEQLTEQRQMLLDIMETRRRNGQPVVKEHRIRLAELDSLLKGETPEAGAVASELVFGHPEATNIGRGKYNHLIPIQVADAASVERFRVRAQQALDGIQTKLSTAEAIVKGTIKGDKKKAKAYLSGQEAVEDSMIRDLLRKETLPELKRLNDVFKGEPGAAPAEAAQGEAPLAPEEPIAPTPENADEVRPELQQGVRVEFDNLDGKGKQPYVIVTREPFDLKNTLVGEVHLTIRNEATGEQVAVEAADISRVLPPREKVPLKQVAEAHQAQVEKTPPPAVVKNPALRAAARKVKGAKITVVKSETDIPDTRVRKSLQGKEAEGVFVTEDGSIYVIEDAVPAGREEAVIAHEAVGHFGVRAELGDATPETLLDIYNKATGKMQDVIAKVAKDYGIDLSTEAGKREATEEALGVLAETRSTDPTTWDKIVSGVRKILRKAGFVQEWSENDIQVLLYKAARRAGKEGAYADNIERIQAAYRGEKAAKGNQTLVASNATITAPGAESDLRFMVKAYHGTPHTFEPEPDAPFGKVKKEKVGTGEGAAAYGWGVLYVAGNQEVADSYRKRLSKSINRESDELAIGNKLIKETNWGWDNLAFIDATMRRIKQDGIVRVKEWLTEELDGYKDAVTRNRFDVRAQGRIKAIERLIKAASAGTLNVRPAGNLYHIELDFDPEDCLDWDKPLSEQSEEIQSKIQRAIDDGKLNLMAYESTGADIYCGLAMPEALGSQQAASEYLASLGIRGIKYADQGSRTPQIARGANEKFNVMANGQLRSFDTEAEAKTFADSVKTFNFVVFNESDIRVVGRNGETLKPSDAMAGETETMLSRKPQADPFLNQEAQEMHGIVQDKRLTEGFPTKAEAPQREAAKRFYDKDPNAALNALSEGKVSPLTSEGSFIWQYTLDQEGKKAAQSGNPRYGARVMGLMLDYMEVGTEMGRAFHTRHDAMLSPRERNELFLNRAFLQPSSRFMETLGTMTVTEREKALESEFERSQQMRFELMMKLGIDIANLDEATLADPRKIAALVRYKQVKDASIGDKVYEYWRNSILSSLGTLLGANPLGNIANTGWDFSIQRSVEALLNLGFKNPEAAQFGELKYVWKHMLGSSRQLGWQNAVQAWSTEQPVLEGTRYDESGAAISDEYGGRIIRVPQRTLLFADELLKGITYRSQIISMAYREAVKDGITDEAAIEARIAAAIANPSQAMIEEATKTARELAFQGKLGTIGQMLLKGKHNKNIFIRNLSRYMFPFVTTPMNIVKQGMAKTPIGSLMMMSKAMHGEYKGNQKQLIRDLAEQVIATATTLALLGMVGGDDDEEPWITGTLAWNSPRGQRDQEQKYRPPQSVRIAGRWYSYARIEPFATSMATIVDLIKAMRSAPEKGIDAASYQAFNSVKQQLKDKTFLSSVGDIIRWADKDQGSKTWSENFAASWVPNMFRQGARAFDPYIRNVNDKGPVGKSILRKMLPIPLLQNPPKRDIWGVAIKKGEGPDWPPATDILYRMVVPVRTQLAITPNNIDRMLFNWNNKVSQKVGEKAWWPELPRMSYKKNGKTIEMTPDEYDKFIQYRGEIARKRLMAQYWRDGKAFNEPTKREVERVRDAFAAAGRHAKARLRRELRITGEIKDE